MLGQDARPHATVYVQRSVYRGSKKRVPREKTGRVLPPDMSFGSGFGRRILKMVLSAIYDYPRHVVRMTEQFSETYRKAAPSAIHPSYGDIIGTNWGAPPFNTP